MSLNVIYNYKTKEEGQLEYFILHQKEIANSIMLFISIYFLFRIGFRLAQDDLYDWTFWAWLLVIILTITGYNQLNEQNDPLGYLFFIPILTYIILKITQSLDISYSVKQKTVGIFLSTTASVITYIITHTLFGFGIPEASITAGISAAILGFLGYNA